MTQRKPIVLVGNNTIDLPAGDDVGDLSYSQAQALTAAQKEQAAGNGGFVRNGTGSGQSASNAVKIGWDGTGKLLAQVDGTPLGQIWTDYATSISKGGTGYIVLPDGLILQWNTVSVSNDVATNFPIAFPNAIIGAVGNLVGAPAGNVGYIVNVDTSGGSKTNCALRVRYLSGGSIGAPTAAVSISYLAIGC